MLRTVPEAEKLGFGTTGVGRQRKSPSTVRLSANRMILVLDMTSPNEKGGRMAAFLRQVLNLRRANVLCLPALGSLGHVELHGLTFLQAAESARLDG